IQESRDLHEVALLVVGNKRDLLPDTRYAAERSREMASLVRKQWKAGYVEVSAKYNWRVVAAFRELIAAVEETRARDSSRPHNLHELHEAIESSKCTIL
ncbi:ras-like protein family member 10A, partial [Hyalella azteca]|uniref:Ras-like protein family member 10A n=1 Tax=Hyalella azteca TaxID=294128 RepID=A0A979FM56_HYAAZ